MNVFVEPICGRCGGNLLPLVVFGWPHHVLFLGCLGCGAQLCLGDGDEPAREWLNDIADLLAGGYLLTP